MKNVGLIALITVVAVPVAGVVGVSSAGAKAHGYSPPPLKPSKYVRHVTNPWFPLTPGTTYTYTGIRDGKEVTNVFKVTHRTKKISGVTATVIDDRLYQAGGKLAEKTTDWYAQDKRGDVVYLGESTKALDSHGNLTDTSGSWLAGRNGAKAGIFMPAHPKVGQSFRQEFLKGQAEDHFKILERHASVTVPAVSSRNAMKTEEWTPLEPGVIDDKFYVRGIGTVKEAAVKGGDEQLELVSVHRGP